VRHVQTQNMLEEQLFMNSWLQLLKIKKLIVEGKPVEEILKVGLSEGMRILKQDGIYKVFKGYTDFKSVLRVCIV